MYIRLLTIALSIRTVDGAAWQVDLKRLCQPAQSASATPTHTHTHTRTLYTCCCAIKVASPSDPFPANASIKIGFSLGFFPAASCLLPIARCPLLVARCLLSVAKDCLNKCGKLLLPVRCCLLRSPCQSLAWLRQSRSKSLLWFSALVRWLPKLPPLWLALSLCFFYLLPGTKTKRNQPQAKPLPPPFAFLLQLAVCMLISYLIYSGLWIAAVWSLLRLFAFVFGCEIRFVAGVCVCAGIPCRQHRHEGYTPPGRQLCWASPTAPIGHLTCHISLCLLSDLRLICGSSILLPLSPLLPLLPLPPLLPH